MDKSTDNPFLIGQKFGRLLVIAPGTPYIDKNNKNIRRSLCLCDCGTQKEIRTKYLRLGRTISCGCSKQVNVAEDARLASARRVFKNRYDDGDLTFDHFLFLSQQECHYCGELPFTTYNKFLLAHHSSKFAKEHGDFIYNGIDRIDNNFPHNKNNVITCCMICNAMKSNLTIDKFQSQIVKIYDRLQHFS